MHHSLDALKMRSTTRLAFALCLLGFGAPFCVHGFVIGRRSPSPHPFFPLRGCPRSARAAAPQELKDGARPAALYPRDALQQNDGINGTHAMAPDIAYFYLRHTLGLDEETMWKITLDAGSALGMTPRNLANKISLLRRTMDLSDQDVRVVIGKQPAVLHYSAERNLAPTILFLVRALDLSKGELRRLIVECPSILGYSLGNLKKKLQFFWFTLGYCDVEDGLARVRELLVGTPKLLYSAVDTGLAPRMNFLYNELEFSLEELRTVYEKNARLLLYSVDANLREKIVFFFILQLHLEPEHVRRILLAYPQVMDYNLEDHMRPIAEYYISELEFSPYEVGSIIRKFPRIFTYSLHKQRHLTGFLRYELALDPQQAKRVIFQAPQVLGLSSSTLSRKLDFLRDRLELTVEELGLVFSKMPTLMCLGISNLATKVDYLERALSNQSHSDDKLLKETVLKQPTLLAYSLAGRIRPRMERVVAAGIAPAKITVGISMSEINFQRWLASSQSRITNQSGRTKPLVRRTVSPSKISYLQREMGLNDTQAFVLLSEMGSLKSVESDDIFKQKLKSILHTTEEVIDKMAMTNDDFETHLVLDTVQKILNFTQNEIESIVLGSRRIIWHHDTTAPAPKIDYLLSRGSKDDVKNAIISRPRLLSYSLEKLQNMSNVLSTRRSKYSSLRFKNESEAVLRDSLELTEEHVAAVLSGSRYLSLRDPEEFLVPKLNYILSEFDGDRRRVAAAVLENPRLLDYSLHDWIMPQMQLLKDASLEPVQINDIMSIHPQEINERMELQSRLNLTAIELERLVPLKDWLVRRCLRQSTGPIIQYLTSQLGGSLDELRKLLLEQPTLLTLSLSKTIQPRMNMLSASECPPTDIGRIAMLPQRQAEEHCIKYHLGRRLDISSNQMDRVFASGGNRWESASSTIEKVDYLLHSVFGGSRQNLKVAIVEEPALLIKSLTRTIQPRAEVLRFLESIGFKYHPKDLAGFFTQSESALAKTLLPNAKIWHPPASSESNGRRKGGESTSEQDSLLATLGHFDLPFATFVHADEANRDSARVVHWR